MSHRVLLAMSGGVDSSVAAHLLHRQGYDVIGLFMRTGSHAPEPSGVSCNLPIVDLPRGETKSHKRGCCSASDAADARRVADRLDIPFYAVDFEHEFDRIIDYFVDEYTHGRTPNPCVMCNNWLKFGRLWEYAQQIGAEYIATGHYARASDGQLLRGADSSKDQSYVLYGIPRALLPRLIFPIGAFHKSQIRELARSLDLRVADKPDSQEICFVPSNDYQEVIRQRIPEFDGSGELVDTAGNVIARHDGFEGFTVGQRKGLGVALGERRYVIRIDAEQHRVVVGPREALLSATLCADRVNWLCDAPSQPLRCHAKIRYLHEPAAAQVVPVGQREVHLTFDEPQSAITPGQSVVFYDAERVLGGGIIRSN